MLALLALGSLGSSVGCYSTTPHRAQVARMVAASECADAISGVFARSGFIQLPTPRNLSMLFSARVGGPYSSFLSTGSGIGVTVHHDDDAQGFCHVTIEALSPDAGCAGDGTGPSGTLNCQRQGAPSTPAALGYGVSASNDLLCPVVPSLMCELTSAPGADNDAAVDELARRVQAALSPSGRVN
jgi:hypothetical protein